MLLFVFTVKINLVYISELLGSSLQMNLRSQNERRLVAQHSSMLLLMKISLSLFSTFYLQDTALVLCKFL
jgi:hypothetical protein